MKLVKAKGFNTSADNFRPFRDQLEETRSLCIYVFLDPQAAVGISRLIRKGISELGISEGLRLSKS